jgi:hypothetical protein
MSNPRDLDESDVDLWLGLPSERGLRDVVLSLSARHGLVATERRWHAERWVVRARSLASTPTGEPLVRAAWQRHADHDLWADTEWPTLPDDVLPPDAPEPGDPSAEARCWLHERPLPECGCPTMGRVLVGTAYERLTGLPNSTSPFARESEPVPSGDAVVWCGACPACRRNVIQPSRPEAACPECGHPWLCWRSGLDSAPSIQWAPRGEPRIHYTVEGEAVSVDGSPVETAAGTEHPPPSLAVDQPAATVAAGPNTRAEGPSLAVSPSGQGEAPPLAPSPPPAVDSYMAAYYDEQMRARRGPVVVEAPLVQPTPAVVALVAQAAESVAKRRNHRWDHGRCLRCGVAQARNAPPCSGERAA